MTTETTDTQQPAAPPAWMAGIERAMTATLTTIGIPTGAAPFCVTQDDRGHEHTANVHYLLLAPLLEIAEAYDVPVTETPAVGGGISYSVSVPVDGVTVGIWTTNPTDARAVAE